MMAVPEKITSVSRKISEGKEPYSIMQPSKKAYKNTKTLFDEGTIANLF